MMNTEVEKALEDLEEKRKKILALDEYVSQVKEIFPKDTLYINSPSCFIVINTVVDHKDEIVEILKKVGNLGMHQVLTPDVQGNGMLYWMGKEKGNPLLYLSVAFSGVKCNMVQVGVREVPVYEMKCEGDSE